MRRYFRCDTVLRGLTLALLTLTGLLVAGCAQRPTQDSTGATVVTEYVLPNDPKSKPWSGLRIRTKTPTVYTRAEINGQPCIRAQAESAWAFKLAPVPESFARMHLLRWQWFVPQLITEADNTIPSVDDSPARVVVAFRGDRKKLGAADRATMTLAKALSGLEMPYASIQYIWSNKTDAETIIPNFYSARIKKLVVQRGDDALRQWLSFERDLKTDFERAYPSETYQGVESIALMTDTDSVGGKAEACYANVVLR